MDVKCMKIRAFLQNVREQQGPQGDFLGAELLLAFVLGKDRAYLVANGNEEVGESVQQKFEELMGRMLKGEPVAYLTGIKEFYGLDFFVDKRVLIPRPETERLVEKVLGYPLAVVGPARILDVGTGSGCIAVSVAKNLPHAKVAGVDISADALEVARKNAKHNGVNVQFLESDLLAAVDGPFDVIVANLPYIGEKKFNFVSKSASDYEPHLALFGGDDGLQLYRKFFQQLAAKSWRPRLLLGEFGFLQTEELEKLFAEFFPQNKIRFEQDYAHIDRLFMVEFSSVS